MMTPDLCEVLNTVLLREENLKLKAQIAQLEARLNRAEFDLTDASKQAELDALNLREVERQLRVEQGENAKRSQHGAVESKTLVFPVPSVKSDAQLSAFRNQGWKAVHYQGSTVVDAKGYTAHFLTVVLERPESTSPITPQPTADANETIPHRGIIIPDGDPAFDADRARSQLAALLAGEITTAEYMNTVKLNIHTGMERILS